VFHRRVFPYPGAVLGLSPIEYHATTLGLSISATRFGAAYFTDNATPTGMLMNEDEEIGGNRAAEVKRKFLNALRGKREPVVLGKGWKYQQLGIAPEESQFLETNQFTAAQCARIYGPGIAEVLGYESGGSLTYATVEGRSLHLLVYALSKWITRAERVLTSLTPRGQYVKLNRKALLSTTNIERFRAYTMALQGRWTTPNEVRDNEDLPPVEWGDEPITGGAAPADDGQANSGTGAPALSGAGGV
jgi:HK97 family phage portal protein